MWPAEPRTQEGDLDRARSLGTPRYPSHAFPATTPANAPRTILTHPLVAAPRLYMLSSVPSGARSMRMVIRVASHNEPGWARPLPCLGLQTPARARQPRLACERDPYPHGSISVRLMLW